jgi:hypothetical protein
MTPGFELFSPSAALDPTINGVAGAQRLLAAAAHFPGGPVMLVFALFWSPVGPGIPAGVLLARHIPLNPALTFALYTMSDVLSAFVFGPLFTLLRRHGRRVPSIRRLGRRLLTFATAGVRVPRAEDVGTEQGRVAPTLFRIATVGFGVDVYTGGALASGLPVPRVAGWASAIAGDLVWFALLLGTSIGTAWFIDDDRVITVVVVLAMIFIPRIARRIFPALRNEP